jgi:flagellar protein FliO/FliZ
VKLRIWLVLCGALTLFLASSAGADPKKEPPMRSAPNPGEMIVPSVASAAGSPVNPSGSGIQLAIYLCLLVALLAGGSYFLKNGFSFLQPRNKGVRKLNVAETRMLGNRQFLVVAEYEGRKMLLGVCPGRIELLSELGGKSTEPFDAHLAES